MLSQHFSDRIAMIMCVHFKMSCSLASGVRQLERVDMRGDTDPDRGQVAETEHTENNVVHVYRVSTIL